MTSRTVPDRVSDWYTAFQAVREELTPPSQRTPMPALVEDYEKSALLQMKAMRQVDGLLDAAALQRIAANDRTAAIVAAMLVTTGIRPVQVEQEDV